MFYSVHKLGTVAHTAMTLMLYTGAARADAVKLGWGNIKGTDCIIGGKKRQTMGASSLICPSIPSSVLCLIIALKTRSLSCKQATEKAGLPKALGT